MNNKLIEFNKSQKAKKASDFQAGDVVKIFRKIKEGEKERIQIFEGIIIAIKGMQSSSPMITVRKVSDGVGIELILPIFSQNIERIEIIKRARVRRGKLYYLRGVAAKKSRMKYKDLSDFIIQDEPAIAKEASTETAEPVVETTGISKISLGLIPWVDSEIPGCRQAGIKRLTPKIDNYFMQYADVAEFGIRARLRFLWPQGLGGSSPLIRT